MAACSGNVANNVDDEKALRSLPDAFGSSFSLEQIASVYCKAQTDVAMAGNMLCDMQEFSSTNTSDGMERHVESVKSAEVPSGNYANKSFQGNDCARSPNMKWRTVLAGSVSSVIGKEYSNPKPYESASNMLGSPIKLNSEVLPVSGPIMADPIPNNDKQARLHHDMEAFLFSMLGDGFQLDRDVIGDVLGKCGYDMQKSMDKLFDVSTVGMRRGDNHSWRSAKLHDSCSGYERIPRERTNYKEYSWRFANANGGDIRGEKTLPTEVLHALFYNSEPEKELKCSSPPEVAKQSNGFDKAVSESCIPDTHDKKDRDDEDDGYQVLRRAVQEDRGTMKEYYRAAMVAFSKGDRSRANKLMDQGNFFCKKARDADEESYKKIFDVRNEEQDTMLLNLHEHDVKAAIRLLKCHVVSLAGTPTFKHLKVIIEMNGEDTLKGARKRSVMKFLEKYSIKWVEDTSPGAILIPLADIDRSTIVKK